MMQTTDLGNSHDVTELRWLNTSRDGCIPLQGEMWPGLVVVEGVPFVNPAEMVLVENAEVVEVFSADGPNHPFGVGILPGRLGRGEDFRDAQLCHQVTE